MKYAEQALLVHSQELHCKLAVLIDSKEVQQSGCKILPVTVQEFTGNLEHYLDAIDHIVCFVQADELRPLIDIALERQLSIGLIRPPTLRQPLIFSNFDIPRKRHDSLELALQLPEHRYDVLRCNNELVLGCLNLGDFPFYNNSDITLPGDSVAKRLRLFFSSLVHLFSQHPQPVMITTAKGKIINTAVTGVAVVENATRPFFYVTKDDIQSTRDRQISVLLLAPSSILSYLKLLLRALLQISDTTAMQGLGYIKSDALVISSQSQLDYTIDGVNYQASELHLELTHNALAINAGPEYTKNNTAVIPDKERIAIDQLPLNDTRLKYLAKSLPFFAHALEEEFKDLFINLKDNSAITQHYLLLMILSCLLATLGLFLDSASVVIGAMVLAPLMAPIISLSMGLLRANLNLTRQSLTTLSIGVGLVLLVSALMAASMPYEKVTNEILSRLHPSLLDLMVAIISGIAGAYATAREHVAKNLPGVAIAVALVPPLCVSGIGLGWLNLEVFQSAVLLFFTNLVGIILAAALTFLVLGFAPFSRAARGVGLSVLMAALVSVPLYFSFLGIIQSAKIEQLLNGHRYEINGQDMVLKDIRIRREDGLHIQAALHSRHIPDNSTLDQLHHQLEQELESPLQLELSFHLLR